jgi:hypothetical protein
VNRTSEGREHEPRSGYRPLRLIQPQPEDPLDQSVVIGQPLVSSWISGTGPDLWHAPGPSAGTGQARHMPRFKRGCRGVPPAAR